MTVSSGVLCLFDFGKFCGVHETCNFGLLKINE